MDVEHVIEQWKLLNLAQFGAPKRKLEADETDEADEADDTLKTLLAYKDADNTTLHVVESDFVTLVFVSPAEICCYMCTIRCTAKLT